MKSKAILFTLAGIFLFSLASSVSAYMYYAPDNYDSFSYHSERSMGGMYGGSTKTNDYNRLTYTNYLPGGGTDKTTTFVRTTRDMPMLNYGGQNYNSNYYNQNNYAPSYNQNNYAPTYSGNYQPYQPSSYNDYRPWYQNYWREPTYPRYNYRYSSNGY